MGMYTMYHSLMIILIKDLDIFEVFNKIKEFKALIKNLSERKIKILRSDNGREYTSKEFVSFCRDVGIKRELTTPYNPQQNYVAERKNRTMLERSRSSYVLMGRSSYGNCLCAEQTIP
jgi:transposase InsO family protein